MRKLRRAGVSNPGGTASDNDQSEIKSSKSRPLISADKGPVIAAIITAAASLLLYSLQQISHIDERLDILEQKAKLILDHQGQVRPSEHAIEAFFTVKAFDQRLRLLELKNDLKNPKE